MDRKGIKQRARQNLSRHYLLLVVLCAISIYLGTEFTNVVSKAQDWYNVLTGQVTSLDLEGATERLGSSGKIIEDLINDNIAAGREEAAERMRALQAASDPNSALGRQKGVLASIANNINSGNLFAMIGTSLHSIVHSGQFAAALMILGGMALYGAVWIFLRNVYQAILRRAFLESRTYEAIPLSHLLHFRLVRRWVRVSLTLFLKSVYEFLWNLTIVGGVIKRYSYFLVPFIAAENPDIRPRAAIALSRRMMDGHKWECFKLELSFLGWEVLGYVTFGALSALWSIPYRVAAYSELYTDLRAEAKAKGLEGAALLNDDLLFEKPEASTLKAAYADIVRREDIIDEDIVDLPPVQRFFARNFGIWLGTLMEKKVYSRQEGLRQQTRLGRLELSGAAYPERLNPLWDRKIAALTGKVSYVTPCTIWSLIAVFFSFCMVGWIWEVTLHLITHGQFVNRGALHGPWLPIYGGGVTLITVLLYRFRKKPMLEALTIMVLCGCLEYFTSWWMELTQGMRWWDYTGYFLNLNGRICGEGLAVFVVGGMAAVYLLVPIIDAMITRVKPRVLIPVCIALLVCFSGDFIYSQFVPNVGEGITDDPVVAEAAPAATEEALVALPRSQTEDSCSEL